MLRIPFSRFLINFNRKKSSFGDDEVILNVNFKGNNVLSGPNLKASSGVGGDINSGELLGKIYSIQVSNNLIFLKVFPLKSKENRDWIALLIHTQQPKLEYSTESKESIEVVNQYQRVHIFGKHLVKVGKRLNVGDRVYISGFLSYYKPSTLESQVKVGFENSYRIGAFVAQSLIPMHYSIPQ